MCPSPQKANLSRLICAAGVMLLLGATLGASPQGTRQPPGPTDLLHHLTSDIIPFFLVRTPDWQFGGYHMTIDSAGNVHTDRSKGIIAQSRQMYLFAVGAQRTSGDPRDRALNAARLGRRFLAEKMLDPVHGGFWEEVTRDGRTVLDASKNTYGQAFAIYALTELARAADDPDALALAARTHALVREKMWDRVQGGFFRTAEGDWTIQDDRKKIDDHLHFLEAVWNVYAALHDPRYRDEIGMLSGFILQTFFAGSRLDESELVFRNLTWAPDAQFRSDRTGHSMESAWFLLRAARLLGRNDFRRAALTIIDRVLETNFDRPYGGIVPTALEGERTWWVQCEGVAALSLAWQATGQAAYRKAFEQALSFTMQAFPDRSTGGWHAAVSRSGRNGWGDKAGAWKAGYHETQMLAYVADILAGKNPDPEP